ncbi:hypothetical protein EXIGLDRAFT_355559 [Exidia glandulosa HHB12029]|uniref:Uncharacterized protein n=1 Tax=Exidia glandulosa HHB12029 TaxID=1314781 RepID=A0A165CAE3_EXIGL|nr:hypothetical protein EXIGLDRAFT_355559 [Exidia glandulosa HHB12029]
MFLSGKPLRIEQAVRSELHHGESLKAQATHEYGESIAAKRAVCRRRGAGGVRISPDSQYAANPMAMRACGDGDADLYSTLFDVGLAYVRHVTSIRGARSRRVREDRFFPLFEDSQTQRRVCVRIRARCVPRESRGDRSVDGGVETEQPLLTSAAVTDSESGASLPYYQTRPQVAE